MNANAFIENWIEGPSLAIIVRTLGWSHLMEMAYADLENKWSQANDAPGGEVAPELQNGAK